MSDVQIAKAGMTGTIGEKISAMAQAVLREEAILAGMFRDVSEFAVKGVDKISFPAIGKFTVSNRSHGGTVDRQAPAVTVDSLNLDQLATIKYGIDGASAVQSTLNWKVECAKLAAEDHVEYFEGKLLDVLESAGTATSTASATFSPAISVEMRKQYLDNKGKIKNAAWIISTDSEAEILSNPDVYKAESYGAPLIQDGNLKALYGIPVVVRVMGANKYYLVSKDAVVYGFQMAPAYAEQPDLNFGSQGVLCVMDQLFGCGATFKDGGSVSKLIIKDNN
jgi:hypothetical protein